MICFRFPIFRPPLRRSSSSLPGKTPLAVYLSGEIHSDWRDVIRSGCEKRSLPVTFTSPNTSHEDSDDCANIILGMEKTRKNWDAKSSLLNSVRTKLLIEKADLVVVRFGPKYRQWNAAFDAGYASALGKPLVTVHPPELSHMLKEVNAAAKAICEEPEQVVNLIDYTLTGTLQRDSSFTSSETTWGKGNKAP